MKTSATTLSVVSVGVLFAGSGCASGLRPGAMAPDFTLANITGQKVTLSQYRGKLVLLSYFATW